MSEIELLNGDCLDLVEGILLCSGTTDVACENLNRKFIGMELDEDFFNIAKERIQNHEESE